MRSKKVSPEITEIYYSGAYAGSDRRDPDWEYRLEGELHFDKGHTCHLPELLAVMSRYSPMIPVSCIKKAAENAERWIKVRYLRQPKA